MAEAAKGHQVPARAIGHDHVDLATGVGRRQDMQHGMAAIAAQVYRQLTCAIPNASFGSDGVCITAIRKRRRSSGDRLRRADRNQRGTGLPSGNPSEYVHDSTCRANAHTREYKHP